MNEVVVKKQSGLGRPRAIESATVQELVEAFKHGYSVSMACNKVGIARSTYYKELSSNESFSDKVQAAQETIDHIAITQVYSRMSRGDWRVAMWWLDRRDRQANNAQRVAEYRDQKKLLVTETHTATNGTLTTSEPDSLHPSKMKEYSGTQHKRIVKLEKQMAV